MKLKKIDYCELNAKQKEIFNFQQLAGILADYGFNCIKLSDDWNGADFLAYHKDHNETLRVQLKGRLTIAKKYLDKGLHIAFPIKQQWCLIEHDILVELVKTHTEWKWEDEGIRHPPAVPKKLLSLLEEYMIS